MNNNRHLKKSSKIAILLLCTGLLMLEQPLWAQAPQAISYQAIARDNNGIPLAETDVTVIFNIRAGSPSGVTEYREQHQTETNKFGLFILNIGQGSPLSGSFVNIDWSAGDKYLQTEINGTLNGTTQLLSVPYAFFAQKAPDQQNLSINGTTLSISGGNAVQLPAGSGATTLDGLNDVNTPSPSNGQVLQWNGTAWVAATPSSGGTFNAGSGIVINGNTISAVDISASNEIQNLSLNGTTLSISGGNAVQLPAGSGATTLDGLNDVSASSPANGQVLQWNGTAWVAATPSSGGVTTLDGLNDVSAPSPSNGQVLQWNGTAWVAATPSSGGATTLDGLNDVSAPSPSNGQVLQWNGTAWVAATPSSGGTFNAGSGIVINGNTISASDISASNEIQNLSLNGTTLSISGGNAVQLPAGSGATTLDGLNDVSASSPANGQVLQWNGTAWVAASNIITMEGGVGINISGSGNNFTINNTGDTNGADDITNSSLADGDISGTFNNLQIKAGRVGNTELADGSVTASKLAFTIGSTQWQNNGQKLYYDNGFVGIGINDPVTPLNVLAEQNTTPGQHTVAVMGYANAPNSSSTSNIGVLGSYNVTAYGAGVAGYGYNSEVLPAQHDVGVYGSSTIGIMGSGIADIDNTGIGILGIGKSTGNSLPGIGIGIEGIASGTGALAGYFQGDVRTDGTITINESINGTLLASMGIGSAGHGFFNAFGPNGNRNLIIGTPTNLPNSGSIGVYGPNVQNVPSAVIYADTNGDGVLELNAETGANLLKVTKSTGNSGIIEGKNSIGNIATRITTTSNDGGNFTAYGPNTPNISSARMYAESDGDGVLYLKNSNDDYLAYIGKSTGESGILEVYNKNGVVSCRLATSASSGGTRGSISVHDENGNLAGYLIADSTKRSQLYVNSITGVVKGFRMVHPQDPTKEIWYACIEGPEAAAYERGTAQLVNGVAAVQFSDHFQLVANREGMTVMLTPLSGKSNGLAVVEKTERGFKVQELMEGTGNYQFDWEVKCVRKGLENFQIIRDRDYGLSDLPSIESMRRENTAPASAPARIETDVPTSGRNIPAAELTPQKGNKAKKQD
jgi:hypothetical protein